MQVSELKLKVIYRFYFHPETTFHDRDFFWPKRIFHFTFWQLLLVQALFNFAVDYARGEPDGGKVWLLLQIKTSVSGVFRGSAVSD